MVVWISHGPLESALAGVARIFLLFSIQRPVVLHSPL